MDHVTTVERSSLELMDYLRVIRRRWRLILLFTVVAGLTAFGFAKIQTPRYEASATVLLDTGYARTILYTRNEVIPNIDEQVTTEMDLMRSASVAKLVAEDVGFEPTVEISTVSADDESKTRAIKITGSATSAQRAADEASAFAESYVKVRRKIIDDDLTAAIEENQATLERLDESTYAARKRLSQLDDEIAATTDPDERGVLEARRDRLRAQDEMGSISARQTEINARNDQLQAALSNNKARGIFRIGSAEVPSAPVSPRPVRDAAIWAMIGLVIGLLAAFLRDYYDDHLRSKADIERLTAPVPTLGLIPAVRTWRKREEAVLESVEHPTSLVSEAYRTLRTGVEFASLDHKLAVIQVTSSMPGEGKTTTAANLAVAMAAAGKRVVLIDCDLRRPRVHEFFGLDKEVGFTSVILGDVTLEDAMKRSEHQNLLVLPAGPVPPNPSELLGTRTTETLITTISSVADHVIIDSPPILPVTDSAIIASYADSTLLVVTAGRTTKRSLARTMEVLAQVGAPLDGIIFNQVGPDEAGSYGYGYGYGYGVAT